ncbi:hypothetical protein BGZ61DRAFT_356445, partial [Ilyonectria robusta]|uniref:uncharacterized protein n=1 Tax=Ilyonectria robusta TaxID=1079257 RepID=UPI001E8DC33B
LPGDDRTLGFLIPTTVSQMPWTSEFQLDQSSRTIRLVPEDSTDLVTSSAVAMTKLLRAAQDAGSFTKLSNWPGEKFPILGAPFPFAIDRAIAPYFGIVSTGVQLNVFSRGESGSIASIWIARRDANKPMYAGMLDNAVGGAVKHGEMPFESLVREAEEELRMDAKAAVSGGTVSWFNIKDTRSGIHPGPVESGVQYVYDLEVDTATVLHPAEAGIDWLRLLSVGEVKAALDRREFKPSCACVMIDFFVRHGIINADNDRDFAEIVSRLHRRLLLPTTYPQKVGLY